MLTKATIFDNKKKWFFFTQIFSIDFWLLSLYQCFGDLFNAKISMNLMRVIVIHLMIQSF